MATPWSSAKCITADVLAADAAGAMAAPEDAEVTTAGAAVTGALAATGATTAVDGNGRAARSGGSANGGTAACGPAATAAPFMAGARRIAAIAPRAPRAAAAKIQSERGRSRTTMTVGSGAAWGNDAMLTGATEPNALGFAFAT
jgi:hypothetical protein